MPEILSQEEIDALLEVVDEEERKEKEIVFKKTTGIEFEEFKKIVIEMVSRVLTGFTGKDDWEIYECYNAIEHSTAFRTLLGYVEVSNEFASYFTDRVFGGEGYTRTEIDEDEIDMMKEIIGNVLIGLFAELNEKYNLPTLENANCVEKVEDVPFEVFLIITLCFGENKIMKFFIFTNTF